VSVSTILKFSLGKAEIIACCINVIPRFYCFLWVAMVANAQNRFLDLALQ
jgi:hypothetical protein